MTTLTNTLEDGTYEDYLIRHLSPERLEIRILASLLDIIRRLRVRAARRGLNDVRGGSDYSGSISASRAWADKWPRD
jgi:hypothetical protein